MPTPTPEPLDTGWLSLRPGIELRHVLVETGNVTERLTITRLDPAVARFSVHYAPHEPLTVKDWAARLQSFLVVNAGYFTPENVTTGLLISNGQTWGNLYGDFAGLFAVTTQEHVSVRWLKDQPYDAAEPLRQAVMSFPVLIKPGGVMGFPADADEGTPARRTAICQDLDGRILILVAPRGYLSLHELARWLAESDLGLDVALNLDGGFSTGLWLTVNEQSLEIDSRVPVPSVISVEIR